MRPQIHGTRTAEVQPPCCNGSHPTRFVFVGERRSQWAVQLGVRWEDGRLAARTLHEALRAIGLDPHQQRYLNLYPDEGQRVVDPKTLARVRAMAHAGFVIVGMGRLVQRALARGGVPHLPLIHPAARGAIRARASYHAHAATVLGGLHHEIARSTAP
jgi:hypothetical protein